MNVLAAVRAYWQGHRNHDVPTIPKLTRCIDSFPSMLIASSLHILFNINLVLLE